MCGEMHLCRDLEGKAPVCLHSLCLCPYIICISGSLSPLLCMYKISTRCFRKAVSSAQFFTLLPDAAAVYKIALLREAVCTLHTNLDYRVIYPAFFSP